MKIYKNYVKKLKSVCEKKGFLLQEIGRIGKRKEYPMYMVTINGNCSHKVKTICFSAGMHGDENAGPWTVIEFLKKVSPNKTKNLKIIIIPVASPSAFDKYTRFNYLGRELNRAFDGKRLVNEKKHLYNAVKDEDIFFFHALHEDKEQDGFYIYNFERKKEKIYRDILEMAPKYFPVNTGKIIDSNPALEGLITNKHDGSFEDRIFCDGARYSMCTETPRKKSFTKRVKLTLEIMNKVVDFVLG